MTRLVARVHLRALHLARLDAERRDRGDVPGWVLITVMTAGLVTAIWLIAGPTLNQMFQDALAKVKGP